MFDFREKSVRWSQTPSPLAYAVYAFINVDNCERPLSPDYCPCNCDNNDVIKTSCPVHAYTIDMWEKALTVMHINCNTNVDKTI